MFWHADCLYIIKNALRAERGQNAMQSDKHPVTSK